MLYSWFGGRLCHCETVMSLVDLGAFVTRSSVQCDSTLLFNPWRRSKRHLEDMDDNLPEGGGCVCHRLDQMSISSSSGWWTFCCFKRLSRSNLTAKFVWLWDSVSLSNGDLRCNGFMFDVALLKGLYDVWGKFVLEEASRTHTPNFVQMTRKVYLVRWAKELLHRPLWNLMKAFYLYKSFVPTHLML